jgi:hypothetical protein
MKLYQKLQNPSKMNEMHFQDKVGAYPTQRVQRSPLATKVMNHPVAPRAQFTTYISKLQRGVQQNCTSCVCVAERCGSVGRRALKSVSEKWPDTALIGNYCAAGAAHTASKKQKASLASHLANGDCVLFVQLNNAAASLVRTQRRKCDRPAAAFLRR